MLGMSGVRPLHEFRHTLALRLLLMDHADAVVVEPPPTTGAVVRTALWLRALIKQEPQIPYIYYGADVWSDASESTGAPEWVVRVVRALEGYALRGAAETIAVSDGVADRVKELGALSVTVVPNGINTDIFDTAADGGVTGKTNPYFVYAGTASEWQGAEVFAQAMSQVLETHPGARLVFLGQGVPGRSCCDCKVNCPKALSNCDPWCLLPKPPSGNGMRLARWSA
nr:glycosyltransferase [Ornithinimicrobium sp. INDO-MA30-4]